MTEVRVMRRFATISWLAIVLIAGCSTSHSHPIHPSVPQAPSSAASSAASAASLTIACTDQLAAPFVAAVTPGPVTSKAEVSPGYTRCDYQTASASAQACTAATVSIDTAPQAFTAFNRWVVETTQNAGGGPAGHAPELIHGIGVLADWVPVTQLFETGTETRWVTVQLTCPAGDPNALALGEALARAALGAESR
jgi:hypothetical protein